MIEDGMQQIEMDVLLGIPPGSNIEAEFRNLSVEVFFSVDYAGTLEFMDGDAVYGPQVSIKADMAQIQREK